MYIELTYDSDTHHNNDADDSDEPYSYRGTTDTSYYNIGLKLNEKDGWKSVPVPEDIKVGDKVFAVYAIYSTGDTFGHDNGAEIELVSLHKNADVAKRNCDAINNGSNKSANFKMEIELDNGEKMLRYCHWDGYFESLDSCNWNEFLVK